MLAWFWRASLRLLMIRLYHSDFVVLVPFLLLCLNGCIEYLYLWALFLSFSLTWLDIFELRVIIFLYNLCENKKNSVLVIWLRWDVTGENLETFYSCLCNNYHIGMKSFAFIRTDLYWDACYPVSHRFTSWLILDPHLCLTFLEMFWIKSIC